MKKWIGVIGAIVVVHLVVVVIALLLKNGVFETGAPAQGTEGQGTEAPEQSGEGLEDSTGAGEGSSGSGETGSGAGTEDAAATGAGNGAAESTPEAEGSAAGEQTTAASGTSAPTTATQSTAAPSTAAPTTEVPPATVITGEGQLRQELNGMTEQEALARGKVVYLTFDDGPYKYTPQVLEILEKYNIKATFFVTNQFRNSNYCAMIKDIHDAGHTVGTHTFSHVYDEVYVDEASYFADLKKMEDIIYQQIGEVPKFIRFPGGSSTRFADNNPGLMTRLAAEVEAKGYHYFDWSVESADYAKPREKDKVVKNVIEGISKRDVSIVLQHDIYQHSVDALDEIITWGLENGYIFLPITMETPVWHHDIKN